MLGITLGFNLMEEAGYLARISFLFDRTMSKVGLQGKAIMPFFMGLGCTIAGTTGTRVVDNWGQRVLAIAMSWAVPCAATLSVVPTIAIALFGSTGGFLVLSAFQQSECVIRASCSCMRYFTACPVAASK